MIGMDQQLIELDLMRYQGLLKVRKKNGKSLIFDPLRKKWIVLEPEEMVRQLMVHYLKEEKGCKHTLIKVEKGVDIQ